MAISMPMPMLMQMSMQRFPNDHSLASLSVLTKRLKLVIYIYKVVKCVVKFVIQHIPHAFKISIIVIKIKFIIAVIQ